MVVVPIFQTGADDVGDVHEVRNCPVFINTLKLQKQPTELVKKLVFYRLNKLVRSLLAAGSMFCMRPGAPHSVFPRSR